MLAIRELALGVEALDGPRSRVFVQAENRLRVQKAILRAAVASRRQVAATV